MVHVRNQKINADSKQLELTRKHRMEKKVTVLVEATLVGNIFVIVDVNEISGDNYG